MSDCSYLMFGGLDPGTEGIRCNVAHMCSSGLCAPQSLLKPQSKHFLRTWESLLVEKLNYFCTGFNWEISATCVKQIPPLNRCLEQILHAVDVRLNSRPGGVDHTLQFAGHKDVGQAGRDGSYCFFKDLRRLLVHVNTVHIVRSVNGSQEPFKHLNLLMDYHGVSNGEIFLLFTERNYQKSSVMDVGWTILGCVEIIEPNLQDVSKLHFTSRAIEFMSDCAYLTFGGLDPGTEGIRCNVAHMCSSGLCAPQTLLKPQIDVRLNSRPGGVDHTLQFAGHKHVGQAGRDGFYCFFKDLRRLLVHVNTVHIVRSVNGSQEPFKHLDLLMDHHGVSNGKIFLLFTKRNHQKSSVSNVG
ncbi:Deoxyguanosinetriphosphate triphosphohydrolase-like protein [Labeo rohita]|uniref:Deoxyguanosinetriphosphate triphosphohydrolase-like protein n=1 Tax=Labeo rohita TaxID=84645 RepID=A0ABQ8LC00_LABRO|nr:Deoxyguanosinetriphosphate triphosphohydrolase-like protein [Labeo rohita]